METKVCFTCTTAKPTTEFSIPAHGRISSNCKECAKIISREWYKNNKDRQKTSVRRNRNASVAKFKAWKLTLKCVICPENDPACLDFHHLDPSAKEDLISEMMSGGVFASTRKELTKCIALCSNCHRKYHAGTVQLPPDVTPFSQVEIDDALT